MPILALGERQCLFYGPVEIAHDLRAFHAPAQEIGPEKFRKRCGILRKAADTPQLTSQAAERIVLQSIDRLWNFGKIPAPPFRVIGMHPTAMIEDNPEIIHVDARQVRYHTNQHLFDAFLVKR